MAEVIDSEKEEMKVIDNTLRKLDAECEETLPLAEAVQRQKEVSFSQPILFIITFLI